MPLQIPLSPISSTGPGAAVVALRALSEQDCSSRNQVAALTVCPEGKWPLATNRMAWLSSCPLHLQCRAKLTLYLLFLCSWALISCLFLDKMSVFHLVWQNNQNSTQNNFLLLVESFILIHFCPRVLSKLQSKSCHSLLKNFSNNSPPGTSQSLLILGDWHEWSITFFLND